ncbi:MAG: Do family serine endopeptidase [candidate division WOR-3 bacterium]
MRNPIKSRSLLLALLAAVVVAFALGALVGGHFAAPVYGQGAGTADTPSKEPLVPFLTEEGESPFVRIAQEVTPAVVNISAETKPQQSPWEDFWPKDFPFPFPSLPEMPKGHALGSGVIIGAEGYIVTNNHVIADADDITITLSDKTVFKKDKVKVIGGDPMTDVALIKVETDRKLPTLEWGDSDSVKVGEWAIAVGNPYGLSGTLTVGVISAKGRAGIPLPGGGPNIQDFIQTDASINPGNSGGPLVNVKGKVVGINSAIRSPSGGNVGIGFAVPANIARQVVEQLRTTGRIAHGYLGIKPQPVTDAVKDAMGLESTEGVLIGEVVDGTPAKKGGLQVGDVITTFGGTKITDVEQFRRVVASAAPKTKVTIDYVRDGKKGRTEVVLAEYPKSQIAGRAPESETWLGLKLDDLTAKDKERLGVSSGVVVRSVASGSPAAEAGIQVGDVITKVVVRAKDISERVEDMSDLDRIAGKLEGYTKAIAIYVWRNKGTQIITVSPGE